MKKIVAALVVLGTLAATPASAWYRRDYGGWGRGPNWGAAAGVAAGAAILGGIIASQQYNYGYQQPYYGYCRQPIYDAWGNFMGYSGC